jgi:hypothetical protein
MQIPEQGEDTFTIVDRPKLSLRLVSLAVWSVSAFLFYKAMVEPPRSHAVLWGVFGIFALCSILLLREFFFRPVRVTMICPERREIVLEESAPLRKRRVVTAIPAGDDFQIFRCDSDNDIAYGVRIRSKDKGWLTIAEYVPKQKAEEMARHANAKLRGR